MTRETMNADLYDSDTADYLSVDDLGITGEQYEELVAESLEAGEEGHIRPAILNGRRVYAA